MGKGIPTTPTPHGTHGGYTHHRCRCEECKAAMAAYKKAYDEKNRERIREAGRAYYAANREQRKKAANARRLANREAILQQRRDDYAANREEIVARVLAWQKAHPESRRESRCRRRLKMTTTDTRVVTARDWRRLCARYGNRCAYCGTAGPLTQDHVVPIVRGGRHSIGNLLPACGSCNSSKNARLLIEWGRYRKKETAA